MVDSPKGGPPVAFTAKDEAGNEICITRTVSRLVDPPTFGTEGRPPEIHNQLEYHTDDGRAAKPISKGVYEIDGVRFTSTDPKAP